MKKQVLITILFAMLMSMPMFAYDFQKDGIYYNIEGDHVAVTYSGKGVYQGRVYIPYQVTFGGVTYPVTAIGEWAFEGGEDMTYLSIPSSITTIGEYAFVDCGSNIEVSIADLTAWCKVQFGNEHSSPLSSAKRFYLNNSEVKQLVIPDGVEWRTRIFPWLTSTGPHDCISKGIDLYICPKYCTFAPYFIKV